MAKKVTKETQRKTVHVREMPVELWDERLERYMERTGKKKYSVAIEALREFLEKEEAK
jgi:nitrogenase molybdenum-iron protein alpha/beta subunit